MARAAFNSGGINAQQFVSPSSGTEPLVDAVVAVLLGQGEGRQTIPAVRKRLFRAGHHDTQDLVQPMLVDALGRRLCEKPAKVAEEAAATIPLVASRSSPKNYDWQPVIDALARQVLQPPVGAASQAATSLGLLLGFRPETPAWTDRMEDHMHGEPGDCEDSRWSEYHVGRGTLGDSGAVAGGASLELALASLLKRLEQPLAKDRHGQVPGACARALGWIGYGRPELVKTAVQPLWNAMRERRILPTDGLWALTNIGYRHPRWMPRQMDEFLQSPELPQALWPNPTRPERVWRVKIGRHPDAIIESAKTREIDAATAIARLRGFLIGLHLSGSPLVIEAFRQLLDLDEDGTVGAINDQIRGVAAGAGVPLYYPGSLAGVIEDLLDTHRAVVARLAPTLWEVVLAYPDHYWPDTIARILQELGPQHVPVASAALRKRLKEAHEKERRASVSRSISGLLNLIDRGSSESAMRH